MNQIHLVIDILHILAIICIHIKKVEYTFNVMIIISHSTVYIYIYIYIYIHIDIQDIKHIYIYIYIYIYMCVYIYDIYIPYPSLLYVFIHCMFSHTSSWSKK